MMTMRNVPERRSFSVYFLTRTDKLVNERCFLDIEKARKHYAARVRQNEGTMNEGWVCLYKKGEGILELTEVRPTAQAMVDAFNQRFAF